jgi:hydrogenase maturation protease
MHSPTADEVLLIGVGNDLRGDDRVGLVLARAIRAQKLPRVRVVECSGDITAWFSHWSGADTVVMIDAVVSGARPGTLHRLDVSEAPLPASQRSPSSSHILDVGQIVELARALHRLPAHLLIFGIEGEQFEQGADLSPAVQAALPGAVAAIKKTLHQFTESESAS